MLLVIKETVAQATRNRTLNETVSGSMDEPNEKPINAADQIAEIHHRTRDWTYPDSEWPGAAQIVFCDAGVPNPDGSPSVYSTLTNVLTERASPAARSPGSTTSPTPTGANRCGTMSAPATPGS